VTDPHEPFEQQLAEGLRTLVDGEVAPADLDARARLGATRQHRAHRRRRVAAVGAAAALGLAGLWLVGVVLADDDPREVRTVDAITSTTRATTTTGPTTTAPIVAPATTEVVTTTTAPATTTTTDPPPEPRCVEATGEPRAPMTDWAEWYQTEPGPDQAASVRICVDDVTPKVGQSVTVTLVGDDPDAGIVDAECGWQVYLTETFASLCRDWLLPPPAEPQPTPTPVPGHIERSATVAFEEEGGGVVIGAVISTEWTGRPHPYSSYVHVVVPVTVHG
jgi:hypothetical protein